MLQLEELYQDREALDLLLALLQGFADYAASQNTMPVLVIMPMKDDLWFIRNRHHFYKDFLEEAGEVLKVIDMAPVLLEEDPAEIYRIWHYTPMANQLVGKTLAEFLRPEMARIPGVCGLG